MSEFPMWPNEEDLRDERIDALTRTIAILRATAVEKIAGASRFMPNTYFDINYREAARALVSDAEVLEDLLEEIR